MAPELNRLLLRLVEECMEHELDARALRGLASWIAEQYPARAMVLAATIENERESQRPLVVARYADLRGCVRGGSEEEVQNALKSFLGGS